MEVCVCVHTHKEKTVVQGQKTASTCRHFVIPFGKCACVFLRVCVCVCVCIAHQHTVYVPTHKPGRPLF